MIHFKHFRFLLLALLLGGALSSSAQEIKKMGEKYVRDLTSEDFHGRGYVNDGDRKASEYIAQLFEQYGLESLDGEDFYQEFKIEKVNRFPGAIDVSINGKQLQTGVDLQVHPTSGSAKGTFELIEVNKNNFVSIEFYKTLYSPQGKKEGVALLFDAEGIENADSLMEFKGLKLAMAKDFPVLYIMDEKLTWGVANHQQQNPIIEVKREAIPEDPSTVELNIEADLVKDYETRNVIGYIPGKKKKKKFVVLTAHYDHLGRMGDDAYIPGANDNASGVAMMLTLVKHYSENPPDYSVVFMAFAGEEAGLLGSKHFVDHPMIKLNRIEFLLNIDLMGTGSEGIKVVNATLHEEAFDRLTKINDSNDYVAKVAPRGEAANSDHYFFSKAGVPAFFIYTLGGPPHYHDVNDKAETLPLTEFEDVHRMFVKFLDGFME